jgi:OOP family OmpA-OmpF porin
MKKNILISSVVAVALSTVLYAGGGKGLSPVAVPVVPIEVTDPSPWYLGAGLVWAKLAACNNGCGYEDVTYGIMLRGGYDYNQYVGVEARYMRTFLDEGPEGGAPLAHAGLFLKPQYPISERFNLYGLLGYGYTENLGNGNRLNYFDSDWGFSAGVGIEFDLSDRDDDYDSYVTDENPNPVFEREFDGYADQGVGWSLFLDYQRLLIKSDVPDLDAVSFGLRYDF